MEIAIQNKKNGFTQKWINYCRKVGYKFEFVNCYSSNIIQDLEKHDGLMWHFHQSNPRDVLFAKQLIYSLEAAGYPVFPNYQSCWHFDDKVGQKYLLESAKAPVVPTYIFYDRAEAIDWVENAEFPKILKLRTGAGSSNVRFLGDKTAAMKCIKKAFGKGFKQYDPAINLKERIRKYRAGKTNWRDLVKALARFGYPTDFERVTGREKGYVYFQDFIPDNGYDIRVNIIYDKASAVRRKVRPDDFRASGSGVIDYDMSKIPAEAIEIAFHLSKKLNFQSMAYDFVMDGNKPLIVEMSYGFGFLPGDFKTGYWDSNLNFHKGEFNPFGWMIDGFVKEIRANTIRETKV